MQVLKLMTHSFWCGFAAEAGIHMAFQDWYGLEGYITFLRERWVDIHWIIGVFIVGIAVWSYMGRRLLVINAMEQDNDRQGN